MVTQAAFRHILGQFATGVAVITTRDVDGEPKGFTASAFASLSLDPPLVLVCVGRQSHTYPALIRDGAVFAVNILAQQQEDISRLFASKRPDKFADLAYADGQLGVPVLQNTLSCLECRVLERHIGGDHTILVASVEYLGAMGEGQPLLHYRGQYAALAPVGRSQSLAIGGASLAIAARA